MHYAYLELEKYYNIDNEKYYHYNDVNPVDILEDSYKQCMQDCEIEVIIFFDLFSASSLTQTPERTKS